MDSKKKQDLRKKLGDFLKKRRVNDLGISALQLSLSSNLDHSKLVKIEKGLVDFRFETLLELAETYKIQPRDMLDFDIEFRE
jgi:predicted transcriptional regulator